MWRLVNLKLPTFVMKNLSKNWMLLWVGAGVSLTTATQLRLGGLPVGIGEIMIVTWILVVAVRVFTLKHHLITTLSKVIFLFWMVSFTCLTVGFLISESRGLVSTYVYHDFLAFVFNFIFSMTFSISISSNNIKKISLFCCSFSLICLFIIFLFPSLIPLEAWHYNGYRFAGWSNNANTLGLLLTVNPCFLLYWLYHEINSFAKIWYIILLIISFIIGIATKSDALLMGWIGGGFAMIMIKIVGLTDVKKYLKNKTAFLNKSIYQIFILWILFLCALLLIFFAPDQITSVMGKVYGEGGQGSTRIMLWIHGLMALSSSPLFGCGPGAYSGFDGPFGDFEAHSTFIDWAASSGVIGLTSYLALLGWVGWNAWRKQSVLMIGALISLILFSVTHYTLRNPIFWFDLMIISKTEYKSLKKV